ncbi:MAG: SpoIIE family protein phosphatase [Bacteroidia bacterium]|nr:SpoIIE family protein phosphatase [Bacteroidia bacterium]
MFTKPAMVQYGSLPTIGLCVQLTSIELFNEPIAWVNLCNRSVETSYMTSPVAKDTTLTLGNGVKVGDFEFDGITKWYGLPENLSLAYDNNYFTFNYIGITQKQSKKVKYQYKLEGIDENWSAITSRTEAPYGNLPQGSYTFKVKAMNSEGYWSKEFTYGFTIRPPWWETWWFRTIAVAFVIALIITYIKWRERKLKREKIILEEKVKVRTAELQQANEEITTKNETLNQQNEEIRVQRDEISAQRDLVTHQKDEITTQRDMVTKQKEYIEEIHKDLTDSIHYAERIQRAVLPSEEYIREILGMGERTSGRVGESEKAIYGSLPITDYRLPITDYFVLFKPKDIVSGDFYWLQIRKQWLFITVSDCTGHGVPGAFMSMLGVSFLNEIVAREDINTAGGVLDELRNYAIKALQQSGKDTEQKDIPSLASAVKDGMDISFVTLNLKTNILQFAGANNPLYIIKPDPQGHLKADPQGHVTEDYRRGNGTGSNKGDLAGQLSEYGVLAGRSLIEIKGDKMPVAIHPAMESFVNHEIKVNTGDLLYLCTDGYEDQFGGPRTKKFMSKRLKELLVKTCPGMFQQVKSMKEQKEILDKTIEDWKSYINPETLKPNEQTDDITVMGIKI